MKESSDSVHFQTQVQAQSCCFSQLTTVLFDVSSSVLSEQAPLPTTALHQVLTAQLSQQLLHPSLQLLLLAFSQPSCPSRSPRVAQLCRGGSAPLPATSPCPTVQPVLALTGSCLVLQLRAGVSLPIFYSTDLREVMLQNLHFSNPFICLRHS